MATAAREAEFETAVWFAQRALARREAMLRDLMSDLSELVWSGDITDMQANEWYNKKADQWVNGI